METSASASEDANTVIGRSGATLSSSVSFSSEAKLASVPKPLERSDTGALPSRSKTRKALTVKDESVDDAAAKGLQAAESFHSLMTLTTDKEQADKLREAANQQAYIYRQQIRRQQSCTLNPNGKQMSRWDMLTTTALVFTATVTPFEVCVLEAETLDEMITNPLAWINRVVDLIFITDVVFNCFMSYQETTESGGQWVYDNRKIIRHYAATWMPLDVITAVPIDLITAGINFGNDAADASSDVIAAAASSTNSTGEVGSLTSLQLVRMIRLVKLGRIVRATRIFHRWEAYLGISYSVIALLQFFLLTTCLAHWLACLWVMIGHTDFHALPDGVNGAKYNDGFAAFGGRTWVHRAGLEEATPVQIYGVAIFMAFSNIFSGSSGTVVPASPLEYYMQAAMMLMGSSVWAYVISSGCGIIATLNPNGVQYRHTMDELNFFARDKRLPKEMTVKLRDFLSQTQSVHRMAKYEILLDKLSSRLKADAALCWARATLDRVPYFVGPPGTIEDAFLASAALTLRTKVFCRSEYISVEVLTIIERGIAAKHGRIKTKGGVLGEDMVLSSDTFRDLEPAVALTFVVQVATVEKRHLEELCREFPLARKKIRMATFRIAFCRAMVALARECHRQYEARGYRMDMIEALDAVREERVKAQMTKLVEPTKRVLANTLQALGERVQTTHEQTQAALEKMQENVDEQCPQCSQSWPASVWA